MTANTLGSHFFFAVQRAVLGRQSPKAPWRAVQEPHTPLPDCKGLFLNKLVVHIEHKSHE